MAGEWPAAWLGLTDGSAVVECAKQAGAQSWVFFSWSALLPIFFFFFFFFFLYKWLIEEATPT